jgi:hypothetical protein
MIHAWQTAAEFYFAYRLCRLAYLSCVFAWQEFRPYSLRKVNS